MITQNNRRKLTNSKNLFEQAEMIDNVLLQENFNDTQTLLTEIMNQLNLGNIDNNKAQKIDELRDVCTYILSVIITDLQQI